MSLFDFSQYDRLASIKTNETIKKIYEDSRAACSGLSDDKYKQIGWEKFFPPAVEENANAIACTPITAHISKQNPNLLKTVFGGIYQVSRDSRASRWVFESPKIRLEAQNFVAAWGLLHSKYAISNPAIGMFQSEEQPPEQQIVRDSLLRARGGATTFSHEELEQLATAILMYGEKRKLETVGMHRLAAAKIPHIHGKPATAKLKDILAACQILIAKGYCVWEIPGKELRLLLQGDVGVAVALFDGIRRDANAEKTSRAFAAAFLHDIVKIAVTTMQELTPADAELDATEVYTRLLGLHHGITDAGRALYGIKKYLTECMDNRQRPDIALLENYAKEFETAIKSFPETNTFLVLRDEKKEKGRKHGRRFPSKAVVHAAVATTTETDETTSS
jgi:hypothetical protein